MDRTDSAAAPTPRWQAAAPAVLLTAVAAMLALLVPLTSGAFWPVVAARAVHHWYTVRQVGDPISPLPVRGGSWTLQPWLAAQAMRGLWNLLGAGGLSALGALVAAIATAVTYAASRTRARELPSVAAAAVALVLTFPALVETQLFATALFAVLVWQLRRGAWWWAVPIIVVWTNVHGSAVVGAALCVGAALGLYGRRCRRFVPVRTRALWAVACCLAVFATPLGWHLVHYVQIVRDVPHLRTLTPIWRPLGLGDWRTYVVLAALVLGLLGTVDRRLSRRERLRLPALGPLLVLGAFAIFASEAERNVVWFGILVAPEIAVLLDRIRPTSPGHLRSWIIAATLYLIAFAGLVALLPGTHPQRTFALAAMPKPVLLRGIHPSDGVVASLEWADYIRLETGATVWADARLERYEPADIDRYLAMQHGHAVAVRAAVNAMHTNPTWLIVRQESAHRWFDLTAHPRRIFGARALPADPPAGAGADRGVRKKVRARYILVGQIAPASRTDSP